MQCDDARSAVGHEGVVGWRSFPAQTLLLVVGVSGQECMNMAFVMGVIGFCAATCVFNVNETSLNGC